MSRNIWLHSEKITFNPSKDEDIDALLSRFGPEGLYAIADRLKEAASADVEQAIEFETELLNKSKEK